MDRAYKASRLSNSLVIQLLGLFCAGFLLVGDVLAQADPWVPIQLPAVSNGQVKLRVVYAENPRIEGLSGEQIQRLLDETRRVAQAHFQVELEFSEYQKISISELFDYLPEAVRRYGEEQIFDFKYGQGDPLRVRQALVESLKDDTSLRKVAEFAQPYLFHQPRDISLDGLADVLLDTILRRVRLWTRLRALDGGPLIDGSGYNEYMYWTGLGYGAMPYDIVLTNQPIISIEYSSLPVHTSLRGGITVGNTDYNKGSALGSHVVLSTFVFTRNDPELVDLRDQTIYSDEQAMKLAGAYLVHEIGHMLFHLGHPFGEQGCVMTPTEMLHFGKWYRGLDAKLCPLGSSRNMQPGSVSHLMTYNPAW